MPCSASPKRSVGLSAGGGSPIFLPRVLPPGKAMQMLMTGEPITAQEAYRLGMVNELHPRAELMPAVLRHRGEDREPIRRRRCRPSSGPCVMGDGEPIEQAAAIMMEAHWRSVVHPDRVEGIRAFNEGREPIVPGSGLLSARPRVRRSVGSAESRGVTRPLADAAGAW